MSKLTLSKSNQAATLGNAVVILGAYITNWDAPAPVVGAACLLVTALLSLVVKD